jgi:hypothetical protein
MMLLCLIGCAHFQVTTQSLSNQMLLCLLLILPITVYCFCNCTVLNYLRNNESFRRFATHFKAVHFLPLWVEPCNQFISPIKCTIKVYVKQSHYRPGQAFIFQGFESPRFQDNWHMKVERLLPLRRSTFTPQEIFLILISVRGFVNPRAILWSEWLSR